jgi:hypothetical protein
MLAPKSGKDFFSSSPKGEEGTMVLLEIKTNLMYRKKDMISSDKIR